MALHVNTPLLTARRDDGRPCLLKMECWQPVGSFKIRGIGRLAEEAAGQGQRRLVSSSGGNAGMAAAWAGRRLGLPVTVVVPATTAASVVGRLRRLEAEVVVHGAVWDEADTVARELAREAETRYVPPFDDPAIWAGHATLVSECVHALTRADGRVARPDGVVLSVGGGGLLCGVLEGLADAGWGDVPVYGVETAGAASLAAALAAGGPVTIDAITSVATTLGARRVADRVFELAAERPLAAVTVTDAEAVAAVRAFAESHRTLVEPACGAALAAVTRDRVPGERLLVVVCGGSGVTPAQLDHWLATIPGAADTRGQALHPDPAT